MDSTTTAVWHTISLILGWSYFVAWSLSFYPQPLLNYRRKSTHGFSINFAILNVLGFCSYMFATALFLFSSEVKQEYAARHRTARTPGARTSTVRGADFAYALHALLICLFTLGQFSMYRCPSGAGDGKARALRRGRQRISWSAMAVVGVCLVVLAGVVGLAVRDKGGVDGLDWGWIDVAYALGYIKLVCTTLKYIPQVQLNIALQSTVGFSISVILLDLAGSIMSLLQLFIDSALQSDWSGVTANPAKFGLGNITLGFDVIFILQHFVLFPRSRQAEDNRDQDETSPLIE